METLTTSELDIYRTANSLMREHAEDAAFHAAQRADELLAAGDLDGAAVWRRIVRAIETLTRPATPGEQLH